MIVVDTTVLVYAVGIEHPLRDPSRWLVDVVANGSLRASTTPEVIQEFAHVRTRRHGRPSAVRLARSFAEMLAPLLTVGPAELFEGLRLFERYELGAFDSVLAATAVGNGVDALVSSDRGFAGIPKLPFVDLAGPDLEALVPG